MLVYLFLMILNMRFTSSASFFTLTTGATKNIVAISPDGNLVGIVYNDSKVNFYSATPQSVTAIGQQNMNNPHNFFFYRNGGRYLAALSDRIILKENIGGWSSLNSVNPAFTMTAIKMSADEQYIFYGG